MLVRYVIEYFSVEFVWHFSHGLDKRLGAQGKETKIKHLSNYLISRVYTIKNQIFAPIVTALAIVNPFGYLCIPLTETHLCVCVCKRGCFALSHLLALQDTPGSLPPCLMSYYSSFLQGALVPLTGEQY